MLLLVYIVFDRGLCSSARLWQWWIRCLDVHRIVSAYFFQFVTLLRFVKRQPQMLCTLQVEVCKYLKLQGGENSTEYLDTDDVTHSAGFTIPAAVQAVVVHPSIVVRSKYCPSNKCSSVVTRESGWIQAHPLTLRAAANLHFFFKDRARTLSFAHVQFIITCKCPKEGYSTQYFWRDWHNLTRYLGNPGRSVLLWGL